MIRIFLEMVTFCVTSRVAYSCLRLENVAGE